MAGDQRVHLFDMARPAGPEGGAKGVERVGTLAEFNPVHLHLFARRRLETYHGSGLHPRAQTGYGFPTCSLHKL